MARRVRIVEVGPRDGLQAEPVILSTESKVRLIRQLAGAGVLAALRDIKGVEIAVLVPTLSALNRATAAGARSISVFVSASEPFSRQNIGCSVADSFARYAPLVTQAREAGLRVRGYVSCCFRCPFQGPIDPETVTSAMERLWSMGCQEIAISDTIGAATAGDIERLGVETGVVVHRIAQTGVSVCSELQRNSSSRAGIALLKRKCTEAGKA